MALTFDKETLDINFCSLQNQMQGHYRNTRLLCKLVAAKNIVNTQNQLFF